MLKTGEGVRPIELDMGRMRSKVAISVYIAWATNSPYMCIK
jgi:hypothetical protein